LAAHQAVAAGLVEQLGFLRSGLAAVTTFLRSLVLSAQQVSDYHHDHEQHKHHTVDMAKGVPVVLATGIHLLKSSHVCRQACQILCQAMLSGCCLFDA